MEVRNWSEPMEASNKADIQEVSLDITDEQIVIDVAQVWRNKMITLAYVAGSTLVAYAMVVSFVLLGT